MVLRAVRPTCTPLSRPRNLPHGTHKPHHNPQPPLGTHPRGLELPRILRVSGSTITSRTVASTKVS